MDIDILNSLTEMSDDELTDAMADAWDDGDYDIMRAVLIEREMRDRYGSTARTYH